MPLESSVRLPILKASLLATQFARLHNCEGSMGQGCCRKLKDIALIRLRSGLIRRAELYWYV